MHEHVSAPSEIDMVCAEIEDLIGPSRVYPISFAIPDHLLIDNVPEKSQDFASGTSKGRRAYTFTADQQQAYYEDYQRSRLGLTYRKGGWDCMRHLEVMANGCLPFFPGVGDIPSFTMAHYPKHIMLQAQSMAQNVRLSGFDLVPRDPDRPVIEDMQAYNELTEKMLNHIRTYTTTTALARYVLKRMGKPDAKRVLYISGGSKPDYLCSLLFHGMRTLLGAGCVDHKKIWWAYTSASSEKRGQLYGRGFTYSGHLEDIDIDRDGIRGQIRGRQFDLVVFGEATRCNGLLPLVREHYARDEVALIDGEDYLRQTGTTKATTPKLEGPARRRYRPIDLAYQGIYFKRELDAALLVDFAAHAPE